MVQSDETLQMITNDDQQNEEEQNPDTPFSLEQKPPRVQNPTIPILFLVSGKKNWQNYLMMLFTTDRAAYLCMNMLTAFRVR
jgi:hypothetical protein